MSWAFTLLLHQRTPFAHSSLQEDFAAAVEKEKLYKGFQDLWKWRHNPWQMKHHLVSEFNERGSLVVMLVLTPTHTPVHVPCTWLFLPSVWNDHACQHFMAQVDDALKNLRFYATMTNQIPARLTYFCAHSIRFRRPFSTQGTQRPRWVS